MLFEKIMRFGFIVVLVSVGSAYAANTSKQVNSTLRDAWGAPSKQFYDNVHTIGDACIGNSLKNCAQWTNDVRGNVSNNSGTASDEGAILMLVAKDIAANGAKFCPMQLQAANSDSYDWSWWLLWTHWVHEQGSAWTENYWPVGGVSNCFWLCKDGFFGDGCTEKSMTHCDATTMNRADFNNYKIVKAGSNIEDDIQMFFMNNTNNDQEYDTILAVTRWTPGGHGAFVAPVSYRADMHEDGNTIISSPALSVVGQETLVCRNGYRSNANKTDCVPVNQDLCNMHNSCTGWDKGFDGSQHTSVYFNGCYRYRCANPSYGFKSDTDKSCVECTGTPGLFGVGADGKCHSCSVGQVFDATDESSAFCPVAKSYTPDVLQYGTKGSSADNINRQCWILSDSEEYKDCVINGMDSVEAKRKANTANLKAAKKVEAVATKKVQVDKVQYTKAIN